MVIKEGPGTMKERPVQTRWPVIDGLEAGTTSQQGLLLNLTPQINSIVRKVKREGL